MNGSNSNDDFRDPWLRPFTQESIWNMPIGEGAVYKPVNFEAASNVGVDIQHLLITSTSDPERVVLSSPGFGTGRCSGSIDLGFSIRVPDNWIVPDAGNSPYGNTPNSNFAILLPNGEDVFEGSVIARCESGGPIHLPEWMKYENNRKISSLKSNGLEGGGQGASGMSALGGTIRLGELINDEPIRHAIKINPWAEKIVHYSEEYPGWKWPAISADNYASSLYNKNADSDILMGSLFAIPPEATIESTGITTKAAQKLFFALQNYGVYFTEDAAWDTWDIIVERNVELEFEQEYGFSMNSDIWKSELNMLMQSLYVITNNSPASIGGGGTPREPLAPDFSN
ncbi:MAG: hypothetical protein BalsKO_31630 [Balneolaceae bacterium]